MAFLNVPYMKVLFTPPRVKYVVTTPMFLVTNASDPLVVFSTSYELDLVIDIGNLMGEFEMDYLTPFDSLQMFSFQRAIFPSSEDLLESMVKNYPLERVSSKWNP